MFYKTVDNVVDKLNKLVEDLADVEAREAQNALAFRAEAARQEEYANYAEGEGERAHRVARKIKELIA